MLRKRQDVTDAVHEELDNNKEEIMGKMKSSQTNVNTTMNQLATSSGAIDGDMKALADALKK
jgi:chromosome condensin MukBEF ATPase and DNA-binding subunit MukB